MKGKKALCELLGTYFFILTISLATSTDISNFAPLAIGFMLVAMVFAFGYISGGHFNPAVTFGVLLIRQIKPRRAFFYVLCQVVGGVLAGLTAWVLLEDPAAQNPPSPTANSGMPVFRAFLAEAIYACCLVSVVLHVACSRQRDNHHYGLAIGMTVLAMAYSIGKISGGAINPAVATALHIQACAATHSRCGEWLWMYWLAPLLGSAVAAFLFTIVHTMEMEELAIYERERTRSMMAGSSQATENTLLVPTGDSSSAPSQPGVGCTQVYS